MKTLKFFLVAFIAISLFACEEKDPGNGGDKPGGKDTTTQVTPDENAMSFSLTYEGKDIKDGDVLDVTMEHYAFQELVAHVYLTNNAKVAKAFTVKEVRNYDYKTYTPSFCAKGNCVPGTATKEQVWPVGNSPLEPGVEEELAMHLKVGAWVDGEQVFQESANCQGVFTVSNGEESVTFTLNFIYVKEDVPADEF
jgi:hypothetical protein